MKAVGVSLLAALAVAGCGGDDSRPARRAATPSPTATATPPPVTGKKVSFRASDGRPVHGVLTRAGRRAPAVVLVHQVDGGADQWNLFVPYLHQAGFTTLAYDGRGGLDENELIKEVHGAVAFLRRRHDVDRRRLGIVGASIGANTAAMAIGGADGRRLRAGIALSPVDSPELDALQAKHRYHPHEVLFMADETEFSSVAGFMRGAVASRALRSSDPGHGVELLRWANRRDQVLDWLRSHLH